MKKTIILMLFITIASYVNGQTVVTLDLADPCSATGIRNVIESNFSLTISPNPTDGEFTVSISSKEIIGKAKIEVLDMKGTLVLSEQIFSNNLKCIKTYNLNKLSKGIYNISIIVKNYRETKRIVLI